MFGKLPSVLKVLWGGGGVEGKSEIQDISAVCGCNNEANCGRGFNSGFLNTKFFPSLVRHLR